MKIISNISELLKMNSENMHVEYKKSKNNLSQDLWETYSAFANTDGGTIVLGIKETTKHNFNISGIENVDEQLKEFWDTINNPQKVNLNILKNNDVECIFIENKQKNIIKINVPKADRTQRPIFLNNDYINNTYKRQHEGDYKCTKEEIMEMFRDQSGDILGEKIAKSLTRENLNNKTIKKYRNNFNNSYLHHPWKQLDDEQFLLSINALKMDDKNVLRPTYAGLLMFGSPSDICNELSAYFLDYQEHMDNEVRWTHRINSDTSESAGNLYDFYTSIFPEIIKNIKVPFDIEDGKRQDVTNAHIALREALANCLIHADYYLNSGIVIKRYPSYITFENPGDILVGKEQMLKGGKSIPRNPSLMKMFNLIHIGERAGSGVPEIISTWKSYGWNNPEFKEVNLTHAITTLHLSFNKKVREKKREKKSERITDKSIKQAESLLKEMTINKFYSMEELQEISKKGATRTKELIDYLASIGKVKITGKTKYTKYIRVK